MIQYFEWKLSKHDAKIIHRGVMINTDGTVLCRYILKANEGIIDPKFDLMRKLYWVFFLLYF